MLLNFVSIDSGKCFMVDVNRFTNFTVRFLVTDVNVLTKITLMPNLLKIIEFYSIYQLSRAFQSVMPRLWFRQPLPLHLVDSKDSLTKQLKTLSFKWASVEKLINYYYLLIVKLPVYFIVLLYFLWHLMFLFIWLFILFCLSIVPSILSLPLIQFRVSGGETGACSNYHRARGRVHPVRKTVRLSRIHVLQFYNKEEVFPTNRF